MFTKLSIEEMEEIVGLQMKELQGRMLENGVSLELDPDARKWLASIGYDPAFGARPLRRALQKYIESPLSNLWLSESVEPGDVVYVSHKPDSDTLDLEVRKTIANGAVAEPELPETVVISSEEVSGGPETESESDSESEQI